MRKEWLWIGVAAVLLSACTAPTTEQQAPQQPYNGPVVEIGGVEPQYEPYNPNNMQDYKVNGDTYRIVKIRRTSQTGPAARYGEEANGNTTALGEQFDPNGLTAAHPTLPIPSYVRVTNPPTAVSWWCASTIAGLTPRAASSICRKPPPIASTCPTTPRSKSISSTWRRTAR